jgi:hypothetical protein
MRRSMLGTVRRPRGVVGRAKAMLGNSQHLWMWDFPGLAAELTEAGFRHVRPAVLGDSVRAEFAQLEEPGRWEGCLGFECRK